MDKEKVRNKRKTSSVHDYNRMDGMEGPGVSISRLHRKGLPISVYCTLKIEHMC